MRNLFYPIFATIALWLVAIASAHADGIGAYPARTPTIAFDPDTHTGLVVYEDGGRIYAKRVDDTGAAIAGSEITVFPRVLSSSRKYKDPTIVFKTPQNRYYIAARQSYPTTRNFPEGPVTFDTAEGIEVTAFDRQMARLADRTLYSPGFLRNFLVTNAEAKPAIVVDNLADVTCCVAVLWQDARQSFGFFMTRMNPDLGLYDTTPRLLSTSRSHIANLSATYDAVRDRFFFAYDACNADVRFCVPHAAYLPAYIAADDIAISFREGPLDERAGSIGSYTYPDVAYISGGDATLAAWGWTTAAGNGVSMARVGIDMVGSPMAGPRHEIVHTSSGCPLVCITRWASSRPDIVAIGTGSRAMIVAPSRVRTTFGGTTSEFTGFNIHIGSSTLSVSNPRTFSASGAYFAGGRGAYSPSGRVVAAWDQGTIPHSVWAGTVTP